MTLAGTKIDIGGVFRCCIETVRALGLEAEVVVGQVVMCRHCPDGMKLDEKGIWTALWRCAGRTEELG